MSVYHSILSNSDGALFDVSVWDYEGDIVKKFWSVTADGVDAIKAQYEDEPTLSVVVEECR